MPPDFRPELKHGYFLTCGWHGCLFLFKWVKWKQIEEKLERLPITNIHAVNVQRFFAGGVEGTESSVDKQGRIAIPPTLVEFAGIQRSVLVRGTLDRAEIWAKERWLEYLKSDLTFERVAQDAMALGLWEDLQRKEATA